MMDLEGRYAGTMAKVTIQDVARLADVSVATVDRVLNRRPGVRAVTVNKVEQAIRELNYQPDRIAARLARSREYRFCFLLPQRISDFWQRIADEVKVMADRMAGERVVITARQIDVLNGEALAQTLDSVGDDYDGVAVVALDHPAVREAINALSARGVTVVTLVSDVPGSKRVHYAGIDNSSAGRTAATLMGRFLRGLSGKVGLIAGSLALRDHIERQFGFEQVMTHEYSNLTILPVRESRDDSKKLEEMTAQLLAEHRDLLAIYNVGGGTRGIVSGLEAAGRGRDVVLIGHELTDPSRRALIRGTIDAVINQDPGHEVRSAVRVLMAKADGVPLIESQERIRIAQELHDVVAHSISVIAVQAGVGAHLIDSDRKQAAQAFAVVSDASRTTLAELRRLTTVMRADGRSEEAGAPALDDLPVLIDHMREAGLGVSLETSGDPASMAPAIQLSVFRIAQEALTNALKHGGRCHATVRIAVGGYSEDRQIDMEALYRDKPNADTIDQVMWNLRTAMRMDRVSPDTLSTYLKTRSFKV